MRPRRPVADDDAGEIDREKSRAVRHLRRAEDHQGSGRDKGRMQALRQRHAIERHHHQTAPDHPRDGAKQAFARELHGDIAGRAFTDRNELDQHQREKDGERIVGAGLSFQGCSDTRAQAQALGVHEQKHRCGIGRCDHGPDQERLRPVQIERIFGSRRRDQGGNQHPDGRQHHRWREHGSDALKLGPQAAVEQDQRQRHRAHQKGRAHVVEVDLARAGVARQHADHQEHQQQGCAEAQREQARQDSGHHQNGAEQNGYADLVEGCHFAGIEPSQTRANTCTCILIVATVERQPHFCESGNVPDFKGLTRFTGPVVSMGRV